jgi:hypothetical protein
LKSICVNEVHYFTIIARRNIFSLLKILAKIYKIVREMTRKPIFIGDYFLQRHMSCPMVKLYCYMLMFLEHSTKFLTVMIREWGDHI